MERPPTGELPIGLAILDQVYTSLLLQILRTANSKVIERRWASEIAYYIFFRSSSLGRLIRLMCKRLNSDVIPAGSHISNAPGNRIRI